MTNIGDLIQRIRSGLYGGIAYSASGIAALRELENYIHELEQKVKEDK